MALPSAPEARPFYQSALERLKDARYLLDDDRTTAAIYLAGYSVECMLKALILASVPTRRRAEIVASFRGVKAHDFEWLQALYRTKGGAAVPAEMVEEFGRIAFWSTALRYNPRTYGRAVARQFLRAAERIFTWADGRL